MADTPSIGWKVRGDSLERTGPYELLSYARRQLHVANLMGTGSTVGGTEPCFATRRLRVLLTLWRFKYLTHWRFTSIGRKVRGDSLERTGPYES